MEIKIEGEPVYILKVSAIELRGLAHALGEMSCSNYDAAAEHLDSVNSGLYQSMDAFMDEQGLV